MVSHLLLQCMCVDGVEAGAHPLLKNNKSPTAHNIHIDETLLIRHVDAV